MYLQWKEIEKQAIIANNTLTETKNAAQGARQNTILQFRRKLTIRNMVVTPALGAGFDEDHQFPFHQGEPVTGQFYVSNVGGVAAHTAEVGCWVEWFQGQIHRCKAPMRLKMEIPCRLSGICGPENPRHANSTPRMTVRSWTRALTIFLPRRMAGLCISWAGEYADDLGLSGVRPSVGNTMPSGDVLLFLAIPTTSRQSRATRP